MFDDVASSARRRGGMLYAYFGVREDRVDRNDIYCDPETPLLESEFTDRWFPFANLEGDYLAINLDTHRVFRVTKDLPALRLAADDLATFLARYADELWNDQYALAGDTALEGVTVEGYRWVKRHLTKNF